MPYVTRHIFAASCVAYCAMVAPLPAFAEDSPGPLRVVIPNITPEQAQKIKESFPSAVMAPALKKAPPTRIPSNLRNKATSTNNMAQPAAPIVPPLVPEVSAAAPGYAPAPLDVPAVVPAPSIAPVATLPSKNTSGEFVSNGVVIPEQAANAPFPYYNQFAVLSALPLEWIVKNVPAAQMIVASNNDFSALASAAGGLSPEPPQVPAMPNVQPAAQPQPTPIVQTNNRPTPAFEPNGVVINGEMPPPATMAAPFETSTMDPTEPKASLSSQSKAIINNIPAISDAEPVRKKGGPVDIYREREIPEFGGDVQVNSVESKGIKVDVKRRSVDVTYDLEKAYDALIAGNSEAAIEIYQGILTNDPQNKEALFGLASTYHRVGQLEMARSLYGKLLQIAPRHRDGLNNFLVLLGEEAPEEALRQMEQLEKENPSFSPIPAQMAVIYKKLNQNDRAIDKMYRALALTPENITYRYNLAIMLDKAGEREKAAHLYQQVLTAHEKGEAIPTEAEKIQQRLTFIRSNTN